jgi:hypothetical protein
VPKLPAKGPLALALVLLIVGCTSAPAPRPTSRTATTFVIPTELPNGRVEITIASSHALGSSLSFPVAIVATRGSVSGPVAARVMASGINEPRRPAEVLVRELVVTPVTVTAPGQARVTLTWDTRDTKGDVVRADAYSLVLEFRSDHDQISQTATATATLDLR